MKRLREESAADPFLARGIIIVRSTAATSPLPEAKRRVWVALEIEATGAHIREAMRPSPFRLLALTAIMLLVGGTAAAVVGRRWAGPLLARLAGLVNGASANG